MQTESQHSARIEPFMAEKRTVYLTEQTLALVRPGESLSGRLNDICERYALLVALVPRVVIEADGTDPRSEDACATFRESLRD